MPLKNNLVSIYVGIIVIWETYQQIHLTLSLNHMPHTKLFESILVCDSSIYPKYPAMIMALFRRIYVPNQVNRLSIFDGYCLLLLVSSNNYHKIHFSAVDFLADLRVKKLSDQKSELTPWIFVYSTSISNDE